MCSVRDLDPEPLALIAKVLPIKLSGRPYRSIEIALEIKGNDSDFESLPGHILTQPGKLQLV